jgi:hypothetical protein
MRRGGVVLTLGVCSALLAGACTSSGSGKSSAKAMRLELVEGTASIVDGSGSRPVGTSEKVAIRDRILLGEGAIAALILADGVRLELSGARITVDGGRKITLERGKVLVRTDGPVAVEAKPLTVRSDRGTFRVDRLATTRVAVYEDQARIDGPGALLPIPTYQESVVEAGVVPASTGPLKIDPSDRWDLRYLKDAIDIDARLANLSRGLEAQLASGTGLDFYRRVLPSGFQVSLLTAMARDRRTDVLIGSLIAYEAGAKEADRSKVVEGVFSMWRAGASWGLVAHRFGVAQSRLFSLLLDSVNRANLVDQGRGPALAAPGRPTPSPRPSAQPNPTPSQPSSSPQPSTSPAPSSSPVPSPSPNLLAPVTDLLDQVVRDLLGGLLGSPPTQGPH